MGGGGPLGGGESELSNFIYRISRVLDVAESLHDKQAIRDQTVDWANEGLNDFLGKPSDKYTLDDNQLAMLVSISGANLDEYEKMLSKAESTNSDLLLKCKDQGVVWELVEKPSGENE